MRGGGREGGEERRGEGEGIKREEKRRSEKRRSLVYIVISQYEKWYAFLEGEAWASLIDVYCM